MSRKLKMNHIKSIIIAVITLFVGFVILTIMGMKDDAEKYNVVHLPYREDQQIEVKNENIKDHKEKIKNARHIDEEDPIVDRESQTLKEESGKTQHKRENPENMKVDINTQLPWKETKRSFEEKADGSINYDNNEDIEVKKSNKTISITRNNNTTSITIINKNPVRPQNTSPQQSIKLLNIGVENNSQHPTSTVPNL
jgi:hypothetical protein